MRAVAAFRQAADDEDQALRAERQRLVDGAAVVVQRRAPALAIRRRKHPAAAIAGDREPGVADAQRRVLESRRGDLVAPRRDAANAVPRAAVDDLRQRPLLPHGGGVERQQACVGFAHDVAARAVARRSRARCVVVRYLAIMFGTSQSGSAPSFHIAQELRGDLREVGFVADVVRRRHDDAPRLAVALDVDTGIRCAHARPSHARARRQAPRRPRRRRARCRAPAASASAAPWRITRFAFEPRITE